MSRRTAAVLIIATVFALLTLSPYALPAAQQTPKNIILIGWDGLQRNHLKEIIARDEVPNLMALAEKGNLVAIDTTRRTDTKAGWAQILTGYEPEVTGVFGNNRFQPIPVGLTVFERLEDHFGAENIYTAAAIGKLHHVGSAPPGGRPVGPTGAARPRQRQQARAAQRARQPGGRLPGEPYYLTKDNMDLFQEGLGPADNVGARALEELETHGRDRCFMFIHFAEPDHPGHAHGENSQQYTDSVKHNDEWLGRIVAKLEELGVRDETLIYVTADHGFDEDRSSHSDAPYVFLATDDPLVMRRGLREDITPTILWRFGVDLSAITPELDGHPLQQAYQPPIW
ncbi:MAG: alkaline phosphatase family protein [Armatimonadota bacterium]|nr:MAG: alkaline phosphatase family protein [Armatimonadota bacterium]